jgi:hypothetical protein
MNEFPLIQKNDSLPTFISESSTAKLDADRSASQSTESPQVYPSTDDQVIKQGYNPIKFLEDGLKEVKRQLGETKTLVSKHPEVAAGAATAIAAECVYEKGTSDNLKERILALKLSKEEEAKLLDEIEKMNKPQHETISKILDNFPIAMKYALFALSAGIWFVSPGLSVATFVIAYIHRDFINAGHKKH